MKLQNALRLFAILGSMMFALAGCGSDGGDGGGNGGGGGDDDPGTPPPDQITVSAAPTALYPTNGANWNDYVVNDGANVWSATDTACTGDETGGYSACIQGGERRVFKVSGVTSCAGLGMTDALGVFDWRCDDTQGYVRFVSKLKAGKRLADLIDFTVPAWKDNAVSVEKDDTVVATSSATKWWSNPLVIDNDGMAAEEMNAAGTLYLVSANAQGIYDMGADKIGLVIKPGVTLLGSGTDSPVVSVFDRKFVWIEGSINSVQNRYGIQLSTVRFSVLRALEVRNATDRGIYILTSHNNLLSQVKMWNNHIGVFLYESSNNSLLGVTAVGANWAFVLDNSSENIIREVTAANNGVHGIYPYYSHNNFFSAAVTANNGSDGIYSIGSDMNTYADLASAHNTDGIELDSSSYTTFTGLLKLGGNDDNCFVQGDSTSPGLEDETCDNAGTSNANLITAISLASSFVGKVAADEVVNTSDTDGAATYPADPAAFDWTGFANDFRAWGKDGAAFPATDNRNRWTSGNGRIWDWSVAANDEVLLDALAFPTGDDTITHTWSDKSTSTFLRHAVELDGDGDGLCESAETCLYTPNIGAYQGHGALVSAGPFTDGTISGVRLMRYASNGR